MDAYVWWAVAGIGLIIVEMLSGTLILLMLGLAAFAGALEAWIVYTQSRRFAFFARSGEIERSGYAVDLAEMFD